MAKRNRTKTNGVQYRAFGVGYCKAPCNGRRAASLKLLGHELTRALASFGTCRLEVGTFLAVWIYDPFVVREDVNEEPQIASTRAAGNAFTDLLSRTPHTITHSSRQAYRPVVGGGKDRGAAICSRLLARHDRQKLRRGCGRETRIARSPTCSTRAKQKGRPSAKSPVSKDSKTLRATVPGATQVAIRVCAEWWIQCARVEHLRFDGARMLSGDIHASIFRLRRLTR